MNKTPLIHDRSKEDFFDILFPIKHPTLKDKTPIMKDNIIAMEIFISRNAAPTPATILSNDIAIAKNTDSEDDKDRELSESAIFGLAYTFKTNFNPENEKCNFLFTFLFFLI